jgi:ribosomal protein S12 methylthiotransferase
MEELLAEAEALTGRGVKELILVAQDTTRYGLDLYGRRRLPELLEALNRLEGLRWLRLHYLYPDEVDDALIGAVARLDKVVKYLDIPIQHCDGKLLRAMNRRGTGAEMETLVSALREAIPGVVLRTSLIVGLPGEDEAAFEALCAFLRRTRWERAGVFAYSAEEGTPAAAMPHQVDETTKQARAETVMALQREIMDEFQDTLRGRILSVLVEGYDRRSGLHVGRSWADSPDVDAEVRFTSRRRLSAGTFARVYVTGARDGDLLGRALGCLKT